MASFKVYDFKACQSNCLTNPKYNATINEKGANIGFLNAIISGEPELAKSISEINKNKSNCMEKCKTIPNVYPTATQEDINKIKKTNRPFTIVKSNKDNKDNQNSNVDTTINSNNKLNLELTQHNYSKNKSESVKIFNDSNNEIILSLNDDITNKVLKTNESDEIQLHEVYLDGVMLYNNMNHWGYAMKWKTKRWGWHIGPNVPEYNPGFQNMSNNGFQIETHQPETILNDAKTFFSENLSIPFDNIIDITFPYRGEGELYSVNHRWRYIWQKYKFIVHVSNTLLNTTNKQCSKESIKTVEIKNANKITLYVARIFNADKNIRKTLTFEIDPSNTIGQLKELIKKKEWIDISNQTLLFNEQIMNDYSKINDCLSNCETLMLYVNE